MIFMACIWPISYKGNLDFFLKVFYFIKFFNQLLKKCMCFYKKRVSATEIISIELVSEEEVHAVINSVQIIKQPALSIE